MKIKVRADGLAEATGPREDILALEALLLEVGVQYSTCFVLASVGVTVWQGDLSEPSDEVTVIDLLDAAIAVDKWRERLAVLERRLPEGVTRDVVEVAVLKLRQAVNRLSEAGELDRGKVLVECDPKPYDDACAGCGCQPGDGRTPGCSDPEGCGYNS